MSMLCCCYWFLSFQLIVWVCHSHRHDVEVDHLTLLRDQEDGRQETRIGLSSSALVTKDISRRYIHRSRLDVQDNVTATSAHDIHARKQMAPPTWQDKPIQGSQHWKKQHFWSSGDRASICYANNAYPCGEDQCCCRIGCEHTGFKTYVQDTCNCKNGGLKNQLLRTYMIPRSKSKKYHFCKGHDGLKSNSHECGGIEDIAPGCCCNGGHDYSLSLNQCVPSGETGQDGPMLRVTESQTRPKAGPKKTSQGKGRWDSGKCKYVSPAECPSDQGWNGMEKLTARDWKASKGSGDGKHMLFYAYGPMFKGKGQIGAWKYNPSTQFIEFYYAKSHCDGMCSDCCNGGGGNLPGVLSVALNPSASVGWGYKLSKKFKKGDVVHVKNVGDLTLTETDGSWHLSVGSCHVDHVYACSKDEFAKYLTDSDGVECHPSDEEEISLESSNAAANASGANGTGFPTVSTIVISIIAFLAICGAALCCMSRSGNRTDSNENNGKQQEQGGHPSPDQFSPAIASAHPSAQGPSVGEMSNSMIGEQGQQPLRPLPAGQRVIYAEDVSYSAGQPSDILGQPGLREGSFMPMHGQQMTTPGPYGQY